MTQLENRVVNYWAGRACDFGRVRERELHNELGRRWRAAILKQLPDRNNLKILDVGTGTGFFSILLSKEGHELTGIDLTPEMIGEAKRQAESQQLPIRFEVMDAQEPDFLDESFDAVVTRNLTWTLRDPEKAYRQWHRVLKPGGKLINFDANYGNAIRSGAKQRTHTGASIPYGHDGVTADMSRENDRITLSMKISRRSRPEWDTQLLKEIGFCECSAHQDTGEDVLRELDDPAAPMFMIAATK